MNAKLQYFVTAACFKQFETNVQPSASTQNKNHFKPSNSEKCHPEKKNLAMTRRLMERFAFNFFQWTETPHLFYSRKQHIVECHDNGGVSRVYEQQGSMHYFQTTLERCGGGQPRDRQTNQWRCVKDNSTRATVDALKHNQRKWWENDSIWAVFSRQMIKWRWLIAKTEKNIVPLKDFVVTGNGVQADRIIENALSTDTAG